MLATCFDFGIVRVLWIRPGTPAGRYWAWAIRFRDGRAFHIVRGSGRLREWR